MNPHIEISPSTQLILNELRKLHELFDKFGGLTKQDALQEAFEGVSMPTQFAAVEAEVAPDNWGGLFDGGDNSTELYGAQPVIADEWGGLFDEGDNSTEQYGAQLIVADNWGGLFEQPAHIMEEHVHDDEPATTEPTKPDAAFGSDLISTACEVVTTDEPNIDPVVLEIQIESGFTTTDSDTSPDAVQKFVVPLPC